MSYNRKRLAGETFVKGSAFKAPRQYAYQGVNMNVPGVFSSSAAAPLMRVGGRQVLARPAPGAVAEQKDITFATAATVGVVATGSLTLLNGVAQGTTAGTRLGRRIRMKSILLRWNFSMSTTSAGGSAFRILVVYDAQSNGTAPAVTDVVVLDAITAPMNLGNARRFKVLCDELVPCIGTAGPQSQIGTRYIKGDWPVEFNTGSAGTIGDIQTGSVFMLIWQDGKLITAAPQSTVYTRVRFTD